MIFKKTKPKIRKITKDEFYKLFVHTRDLIKAESYFIKECKEKTNFDISGFANKNLSNLKEEFWKAFKENGRPDFDENGKENGSYFLSEDKWNENPNSEYVTILDYNKFRLNMNEIHKLEKSLLLAKEMSAEYLSSKNGQILVTNLIEKVDKGYKILLECARCGDSERQKEIEKLIKIDKRKHNSLLFKTNEETIEKSIEAIMETIKENNPNEEEPELLQEIFKNKQKIIDKMQA